MRLVGSPWPKTILNRSMTYLLLFVAECRYIFGQQNDQTASLWPYLTVLIDGKVLKPAERWEIRWVELTFATKLLIKPNMPRDNAVTWCCPCVQWFCLQIQWWRSATWIWIWMFFWRNWLDRWVTWEHFGDHYSIEKTKMPWSDWLRFQRPIDKPLSPFTRYLTSKCSNTVHTHTHTNTLKHTCTWKTLCGNWPVFR